MGKLRTNAYAGCVASLAIPVLVIPCYTTALLAVELTIKGWWKEHAKLTADLQKFESKFQSIGKQSENLITVVKSMYTDLTDVKNQLEDKEENIVASDDFDFWQTVILDEELPELVKDLEK